MQELQSGTEAAVFGALAQACQEQSQFLSLSPEEEQLLADARQGRYGDGGWG